MPTDRRTLHIGSWRKIFDTRTDKLANSQKQGVSIVASNTMGIGQHRDQSGAAPNSGQRQTPRDPELGKKAVPASDRGADINTATKEAE